MTDLQSRLNRLAAAERRANRRDRDNRYGNHKRPPYGYVRTAKRQAKPERDYMTIALACLVILIFAACA